LASQLSVAVAPVVLPALLLGAGAAALLVGAPGDEPRDRADDGEEEDEDDPRDLRQVAHDHLVGLDDVDEAVHRQREAEEHGQRADHRAIIPR